ISRIAEERPEASHGFAFTTRGPNKRPRSAPFMILLLTIVDHCVAQRRAITGQVTIARMNAVVEWQDRELILCVGCADVMFFFEENGPERKPFIMSSHYFLFIRINVGCCRRVFVLMSDQRPKLPAF